MRRSVVITTCIGAGTRAGRLSLRPLRRQPLRSARRCSRAAAKEPRLALTSRRVLFMSDQAGPDRATSKR